MIDLFGLTMQEVRERFPAVYQWLLDHLKPGRQAKAGGTTDSTEYAKNWWLFGKTRPTLREALKGLRRYIATVETAKHRVFVFLPAEILPDNKLVAIASDDAYHLGVLSSRVHVTWALAAGGNLGFGNDPVYAKTRCFDPFPFPDAAEEHRERIRRLGEALDQHRKTQQEEHPDLSLTAMYNVLEKERAGAELNPRERKVHEQALISLLAELHSDLDHAVADAYDWPSSLSGEEILEKLVALNAERAAEEREGRVRWLRPGFQALEIVGEMGSQAHLPGAAAETAVPAVASAVPWPSRLPERVAAVRDLLGRGGDWTIEQTARAFRRARRNDVAQILASLEALGLTVSFGEGPGKRFRATEHRPVEST